MGRKISEVAAEELTEELFDCVPENLFTFLKSQTDRARDHDWMGGARILDIAQGPHDIMPYTDNLLTSYGNISIETIRTFKDSYIGNQVRPAQDTHNLYQFLMNSISDLGKSNVLIWEVDYQVRNRMSGNLLLKIIIRETSTPMRQQAQFVTNCQALIRTSQISPNLINL